MTESLLVHEIYLSIQGVSIFARLPCAFVRLTGCDLRCSYCDTVYAFKGGKPMRIDDIVLVKESAAQSILCDHRRLLRIDMATERKPTIV